jgi:hypothetical protein
VPEAAQVPAQWCEAPHASMRIRVGVGVVKEFRDRATPQPRLFVLVNP